MCLERIVSNENGFSADEPSNQEFQNHISCPTCHTTTYIHDGLTKLCVSMYSMIHTVLLHYDSYCTFTLYYTIYPLSTVFMY